ncbi:MAG: c-type cytochrome [Burkholderiaceae bacterium]
MSAKQCVIKQCTKSAIAGLATLGLIFSSAVFATDTVANPSAEMRTARRGELITMVRQDCGSCHGLTLKGGLGPALLPESLQNKSVDYLKTIILHGRPDTAMPPWQRFLSEAEAEWIVINLQKGFPSEH